MTVYLHDIGLWLSPVKGSRPLPCSSFSLTKTNEDCAIMFGGSTPSGKSSEAHALHLPTMVSHFQVTRNLVSAQITLHVGWKAKVESRA